MPTTVDPREIFLTIPFAATPAETVTVTVESPMFDLVEVYLVCDRTTSMASNVTAINTAAKNLIDTLFARTDVTFRIGIGHYADTIGVIFTTVRGYSALNATVLKNSIDSQWNAGAGNPDDPESQSDIFIGLSEALTAPDMVQDTWWSVDEEGVYGKPIVVIFGDNPFHDDAAGTLLNDEVLPKLIASGLGTIQVDCGTGSAPRVGLDGQAHSDITGEDCGPGQATAIANATGGALFALSGSVETDIEDAIDTYLNTAGELSLVSAGDTDPLVASITPGSHSPVVGSPATDYEFDVDFSGTVAQTGVDQTFEGTLDAYLDGSRVNQVTVRIVVPKTGATPTACIPTDGLTLCLESRTVDGADGQNIVFWDEARQVENGWYSDFYEDGYPGGDDTGAEKYSGVANGKSVLRWTQAEDSDPWDYLYRARHRSLCWAGATGYEGEPFQDTSTKDVLSRTGWTIAMLLRWRGPAEYIVNEDSFRFYGFFQDCWDGVMHAGIEANWDTGSDVYRRPYFRYENFYEPSYNHYFDPAEAEEWVVLKARWDGSELKVVANGIAWTTPLASFPYAMGVSPDELGSGISVGAVYLPYFPDEVTAEMGALCMWNRSLTNEEFDGLDACLRSAYEAGGAGLFSWVFACC